MSPGPGSPNRIQSKAPGLAAGSRSKSNDEQEQSSGMKTFQREMKSPHIYKILI